MNIADNALDRVLRILGAVALAAVTIFVVVRWQQIPDSVPSHYNIMGEVDAWSRKSIILFPVGMGWFVYVMMTVLGSLPQAWNTGVRVTTGNRYIVFRILKSMILILNTIISVFLAYMAFTMAKTQPLGPAALILFLIGVALTTVVCIALLFRNR